MRHEVGELGGRLLGLGEAGHQVPLLVQAEHLVRGERGHGLHTREVSPHRHLVTLRGRLSVVPTLVYLPLQQVQVADHGVSPRVRVLRVLELPGQHLLRHVLGMASASSVSCTACSAQAAVAEVEVSAHDGVRRAVKLAGRRQTLTEAAHVHGDVRVDLAHALVGPHQLPQLFEQLRGHLRFGLNQNHFDQFLSRFCLRLEKFIIHIIVDCVRLIFF